MMVYRKIVTSWDFVQLEFVLQMVQLNDLVLQAFPWCYNSRFAQAKWFLVDADDTLSQKLVKSLSKNLMEFLVSAFILFVLQYLLSVLLDDYTFERLCPFWFYLRVLVIMFYLHMHLHFLQSLYPKRAPFNKLCKMCKHAYVQFRFVIFISNHCKLSRKRFTTISYPILHKIHIVSHFSNLVSKIGIQSSLIPFSTHFHNPEYENFNCELVFAFYF